MDYTIDRTSLKNLIDEQVSREAMGAVDDKGVSLYDTVVIKSRDADAIERYLTAAVNEVRTRLADICTWSSTTASSVTTEKFSFLAPDMDASHTAMISDDLTRFLVMDVCRRWFTDRYPSLVAEYEKRSQTYLERAVVGLKTRKAYTRRITTL